MTNKNISIFALVILVIVAGIGIYYFAQNKAVVKAVPPTPILTAFDPLNATYIIEGRYITLVNGKSGVSAAPDSATKITTLVFGQPVSGDLNGDGRPDAAMMLMQSPGGTGTFFYAAAAINTSSSTVGTNAVLLGDRIVPQNVEVKNGQIVANYAERDSNDPMSAKPSVGVSKYLTLNGTELQESNPMSGVGERCGGNMMTAPTCIAGYHCAPEPNSHLPLGDVGGTCVRDAQ